jgi:hypothetical protein
MPSSSIRSLQIHRLVARFLHLYVVFDGDQLRFVRSSAHLTKKSAKPPDGVGGTLTINQPRHMPPFERSTQASTPGIDSGSEILPKSSGGSALSNPDLVIKTPPIVRTDRSCTRLFKPSS